MPELLEVNDIVEACGTRFIIVEVHPTRPANPYVAIKERGNGAKYKLGHKHFPVKVGHASEDHYLLDAVAQRELRRLGDRASELIRDLATSVIAGESDAVAKAKRIISML